MKPQSYLRDIANYVFKMFCGEMDSESLESLIKIVNTPKGQETDIADSDEDNDDDDEDSEIEIEEDPFSDDDSDSEMQ